MGCYRTILVAIDGSPDAAAALRHATSLARDQHARLILLTVVPSGPPPTIGPAGAVAAPIDTEAMFARILREAVESVPQDVGVESRLVHGRPAKRIVEVAQGTGSDLIVMGFHGHGRLHHALIGSVSDSVLGATALPVLLMRGCSDAPRLAPAAGAGAD